MQYRNNPFFPRRYTYTNNPYLSEEAINSNVINAESIKIADEIPLPNNSENPSRSVNHRHGYDNIGIIDFLKERITIEEIILIGLIIVLLFEKVADEMLLIMLLYVLVF